MVDGVEAAAALSAVVVEQTDGIFAEHDDGCEVAEGHERHGDVGESPHEIERHDRSGIDDASDEQTVDIYQGVVVTDEADVGLSVVIVGYYACEGKEKYRDADKCRADV